MTNKEKIILLTAQPIMPCCLVGYYQNLLEKVGTIKSNYSDYMITDPINCEDELLRVSTADYDLCCALLTMLFREDHFAQFGCFENRFAKGDVQLIIDRMVFLLEQKEEKIKGSLSKRVCEYKMFEED